MKIAVLSDIHSNVFALAATLQDVFRQEPDRLVFLGDYFSYYPWAVDTFKLLRPLLGRADMISGNHDRCVLGDTEITGTPFYQAAVIHNHETLQAISPEALDWLASLPDERELRLGGRRIHLVHGTPDDPCNGRFYPDNPDCPGWFPREDEILLMGHTHYPFLRRVHRGGWIMNPGSVGQPRDGNPMPSWGFLDLSKSHCSLQRSRYDQRAAMALLSELSWEPRAIAALNKTRAGPLAGNSSVIRMGNHLNQEHES